MKTETQWMQAVYCLSDNDGKIVVGGRVDGGVKGHIMINCQMSCFNTWNEYCPVQYVCLVKGYQHCKIERSKYHLVLWQMCTET